MSQFLTKTKYNPYIPFILFGCIFLLAQCFVTFYPGDDTYFISTVSESSNIFNFVLMRYETWSGRIASEFIIGIFSLINLWFWKICNTIIAISFLMLLSKIIRLGIAKCTENTQLIINSFVCVFFFLIPVSVTSRACSWFTGSFYYLWPTFFCLLAMLPFLYKLYGKHVSKWLYILALISTCYAAYMEQTVAVLICFGILSTLYLYINNRKWEPLLFIQVIFTLIHLTIYNLAPGNGLRTASETLTWYPNFTELTLPTKIIQGLNWTHHHLINETNWLLLTLSLLLFISILKSSKAIFIKAVALIPTLFYIGNVIPFNKLISQTTSFEYSFDVESILAKIFYNPMQGVLPSIIGTFIIVLLGLLILLAIPQGTERYLCFILYLAALASGYVLGLSPTIFASGPRIFFLTNILLIYVIGLIFKDLLSTLTQNAFIWRLSYILYSSLALFMACIYVGGILVKTLFKID